MKIFEITSHELTTKMPTLYLDMDGVQADFFTQWARWHGSKTGTPITKYKEIGDKQQREESIKMMQQEGPEFVYKFFATLPVLDGFNELIRWISSNDIPCVILSAPLRSSPDDREKLVTQASIRGKKDWLAKHNPNLPAIFDGQKEKYAMKGGHPNVLVDDFKKYIDAWTAKGGIGILHRWMDPSSTIARLEEIYKK
jgi:hypothetical protein